MQFQKSRQFAKNITNTLISTIENDINNNVLEVSNRPQYYNCKTSRGKTNTQQLIFHEKDMKQKIHNIQKTKDQMIRQIKDLEEEENKLRKSTILCQKNKSNSQDVMRSQITEQQRQLINAALKKKRKFQQNLKHKEQKLLKMIAEQQQTEARHKKKLIQQRNQSVRKQLKRKHEEMESRQRQRKEKIIKDIEKLNKIKQTKFYYKTKEQELKIKVLKEQQDRKRKLLEIRQHHKLKVQQIKQHQQKYLQKIKEKELSRELSVKSSRANLSNIEEPYKSIYFKRYVEQQQRLAKIQSEKTNYLIQNINNRKKYSKDVKELLFPKLKISEKRNNFGETSLIEDKTLTEKQQIKRGNDYMRHAHEKITEQLIHKDKQQRKKSLLNDNPGGYSGNYEDYLKEIKPKSPNRPSLSKSLEKLIQTGLKQSKKIQKASQLIRIEQYKAQNSSDMINSIKNKLRVLDKLVD